MTPIPWWRRPPIALGVAGGLYACVFGIRAAEVVDVEAADSLLAAPIALAAVAFGLVGGLGAGLLAAGVFAAGEAMDSADLTWDEVAVRALGFAALGWFVGAAAMLLERTRARFMGAFDDAPQGIVLTDAAGRISVANVAIGRLVRRPRESLVGQTIDSLAEPLDLGEDDEQRRALLANEIRGYTLERRLVTSDGQAVPVQMAVSRMGSRREPSDLIVHFVDLSAQRRYEQQLAHLADHDPLTGLFNRRRFDHELNRHLLRVARHGPTGAVLLLDLDHFKYVNDTLGHSAGDVVLRAIAAALADRVRAEDVLARLGGDEFAVLLASVQDGTELEAAAADILAVINEVHVPMSSEHGTGGSPVRVTASVGAVLITAFNEADRLLAAADLAMYEAKEGGRGQLRVHTPTSAHAQRIRAGFTWGERIRRALEDQRFRLHLQPIVPLTGAGQKQYEVLLRLDDEGRLWQPAEFLGHAERLGMMAAIDKYVIEHVIGLLGEMPSAARPVLEVNLSAASLGDAEIHTWIEEALKQHRVRAGNLIFEITETVAIANLGLAADTIHKLRAGGCGFALDDFGVGVSSFYYLRELPFDLLKIDGEFVRDLPTNRANQVIVRAMIESAHGLTKTTVAEYVESREVADILRRLGCDYAQGHLFGVARPSAEILGVGSG